MLKKLLISLSFTLTLLGSQTDWQKKFKQLEKDMLTMCIQKEKDLKKQLYTCMDNYFQAMDGTKPIVVQRYDQINGDYYSETLGRNDIQEHTLYELNSILNEGSLYLTTCANIQKVLDDVNFCKNKITPKK